MVTSDLMSALVEFEGILKTGKEGGELFLWYFNFLEVDGKINDTITITWKYIKSKRTSTSMLVPQA